MTEHTMFKPNEPRHTVHDVALEKATEESTPTPIHELARTQAEAALRVLAEVMRDKSVTASTRVIAATEVIDRAWGKAPQAAVDDADHAKRLETIRQIIVDPRDHSGEGIPAAAEAGEV